MLVFSIHLLIDSEQNCSEREKEILDLIHLTIYFFKFPEIYH